MPAFDWHFCTGGFAGGKCLGFQLVIDFGIDVSRVERDMTEPGSDSVDVDTGA